MSKEQLTPERHSVFNEFDRQGLLLGLPRLVGETNAAYKRRLFDVLVHRADSSYTGLIHGITRELGLSIVESLQIVPVTDVDGNPLLTMPAVVFQDTKCYLYSDYSERTLLSTIDRFELSEGSFTLKDLITTINNTGYFTATLLDDGDAQSRSMTIFNQKSINRIPFEDISNKGIEIYLQNSNLIPNTVSVRSNNLNRRVDSQIEMTRTGDYYVDLANGILFTIGAPAPGSSITYEYRNDTFIVESSPIIIHNLQSADFRTKMFEQITNSSGETSDGLPTEVGANIINELLSVFPSNWGI